MRYDSIMPPWQHHAVSQQYLLPVFGKKLPISYCQVGTWWYAYRCRLDTLQLIWTQFIGMYRATKRRGMSQWNPRIPFPVSLTISFPDVVCWRVCKFSHPCKSSIRNRHVLIRKVSPNEAVVAADWRHCVRSVKQTQRHRAVTKKNRRKKSYRTYLKLSSDVHYASRVHVNEWKVKRRRAGEVRALSREQCAKAHFIGRGWDCQCLQPSVTLPCCLGSRKFEVNANRREIPFLRDMDDTLAHVKSA